MDATYYLSTVSLLFLSLSLFVRKGLSISCFTCNTYHHGEQCDNMPKEVQHLYTVDCDELRGNKTFIKCRKMVQTFKNDVRVIRQCATGEENACRIRTGTLKVRIEYCECDEDFCNSASKNYISFIGLLFSYIFIKQII